MYSLSGGINMRYSILAAVSMAKSGCLSGWLAMLSRSRSMRGTQATSADKFEKC